MAEIENVKILQVDTEPSVKSVKDLRKAMKELNDSFIAGKVSEEQYRKGTEKLEQTMFGVTDAHRDARLAVNDFGVQMKNVLTIGKSVSAGLTGIQAGMNALGLESAGVAEQISKLQNLQAMTQAFGALKDDGVKAFKGLTTALKGATAGMSGFKKALIGTGIGAIVVLIGELIAHFDEVNEWVKKVTGGTLDLTKVFDGLKGVFGNIIPILKSFGKTILDAVISPIKSYLEVLKGVGKIMVAVFKGEWSSIGDIAKEAKDNALAPFKEVAADAKELGGEFSKGYNDGVEAGEEKANEEAAKKRQEEWEKRRAELEEHIKQELALKEAQEKDGWNLTEEGKKYYDDYFKTRLSWYEKDSKEYNQILIEKLNYDKEYTGKVQEESDKQIEAEKKAAQEKRQIWEKEEGDIASILDRVADSQNDDRTNELNALQDKFLQQKALLESHNIDTLELEEAYKKKRQELLDKYAEEDRKREEARKKKEEEDFKNQYAPMIDTMNIFIEQGNRLGETWGTAFSGIQDIMSGAIQAVVDFGKAGDDSGKRMEAMAKMSAIAFDSTAAVLDSLAAQQDTTTKEGFEQAKKYQIAGAVMTTLSSSLQALAGGNSMASQMGLAAPVGWAMGAAMATVATTMGAINIAKIKQQKMDGGGAGAASASPSVNFNAASALNNPVLNTQQVIGDSEQESMMKDTKVYVTESDIASTSNRVKVQESENSI